MITVEAFSTGRPGGQSTREEEGRFDLPPGGPDLHKLDGRLLRVALTRTRNNQTKAAKLLHLSRDAFRYRLEKHGML